MVVYSIFIYPLLEIFAYYNLLHPKLFGAARHIESLLVKIGVDLFKGTNTEDEICGVTSSGGSESIIFAILAYRNRAIEKGITEPEL